jgi:hypothetical protein
MYYYPPHLPHTYPGGMTLQEEDLTPRVEKGDVPILPGEMTPKIRERGEQSTISGLSPKIMFPGELTPKESDEFINPETPMMKERNDLFYSDETEAWK